MGIREQREQERQCAQELYEAVKQAIDGSGCTFRDVIAVLNQLEGEYKKACFSRKVHQ